MNLLELFNSYQPYSTAMEKPYIIAEAGVNHEGSMDTAKRLIDDAAEGGAQAVKFQTYRAETIAVKNSPAYWDTSKEKSTSQYNLFKKYDSFWKNEFEQLKYHCEKAKIEFLSTPFDSESALFLNDLVDVFKISSSDITNKPFIELICRFEKPIILSTGAAYLHEIQEAIGWIEFFGNSIALLHCVLNYPTADNMANLGMIIDLKRKFPDKIIGYSDHTLPGDMTILEVATLLGSSIIEKHFTHDKSLSGNDHYHSMDKYDLRLFWKKIDRLFTIIGLPKKKPIDSEHNSRKFARRSIISRNHIKANQVIAPNDLICKRPGEGISPKDIDQLIGKTAARDIPPDEIIMWNMVNNPH
jgi:N-acetylneuraminate synthase